MGERNVIAGIEQIDPAAAFEALTEGDAALVDVRTKAEWSFVGLPELSELGIRPILAEWKSWPAMAANPDFADQVMAALGGARPGKLLFLCRSGARSQDAAKTLQALFEAEGAPTRCFNVAEGFEGDLGHDGHRGGLNGWKKRGLPWRQS